MRKIKIRGLTSSGEWAYGLLAKKIIGDMEAYYISNSAGMPFAYQSITRNSRTIHGLAGQERQGGLRGGYHQE